MIIDKKRKQVFVHIPKTGGKGITRNYKAVDPICSENVSLFKHNPFGPGLPHAHLTLEELYKLVPEAKEMRTWSIVRNPFDRYVSYYHYGIKHLPERNSLFASFEEFLYYACTGYKMQVSEGWERAKMTQADQIFIDGKIGVDEILLFEEVFKSKSLTVGGLTLPLAHVNSSRHYHYREYYADETMRELVWVHCADEIKMFNYKF